MATFDAVPKDPEVIFPLELIDPYTIRGIESDLASWERISCLFFLIEDYKTGYDAVSDLVRNKECISEFLKSNRVKDWQEKVIEILVLLQNNEVLIKLGIPHYKDMHITYQRDTPELAIKVDERAKAFYHMFENLSESDSQRLLHRIYEVIPKPDSKTWLEEPLEVHLLWWIKQDLITINKGKWTLKKLLRILKELEMSGNRYYNRLEKYDDNTTNDPCCDDRLISDHNIPPTVRGEEVPLRDNETDKFYQIKKGLVVVFNQMRFSGPMEYDYRYGSEMDCQRIEKVFKNNFGFNHEIFTNAGREKIYSELDNLQTKGKDYDCVVVFILSHGTKGNIIASDGLECPIETIKTKLCIEALNGKPKVLVIQACQTPANDDAGSELATDGPTNPHNHLDIYRDIVVYNSTIPGERAVRDPQKGTWFIKVLCEVLVELQQKPFIDFMDCVIKVNGRFAHMEAPIDNELVKQVPLYSCTLSKKLMFPIKSNSAPSG